jgi:methyl-accepting chemotaxis protein
VDAAVNSGAWRDERGVRDRAQQSARRDAVRDVATEDTQARRSPWQRRQATPSVADPAVALATYLHDVLLDVASGRSPAVDRLGLWLAVVGFVLAAAAVIGVEALRVARGVHGPELRLRLAMQRIRDGDLGFRVTLRRGDLLGGLAQECNELLEWLNQNPPVGARVGSDVVEVDDAQREAER